MSSLFPTARADRSPFAVVVVAPIGTKITMAFVDYADGRGGYESFAHDVYPDSAAGTLLRHLRGACKLGINTAARALGIPVVEYSGLERGRLTLATANEWARAGWVLRDEAQRIG